MATITIENPRRHDLTPEQRRLIAANREAALRKRGARLGAAEVRSPLGGALAGDAPEGAAQVSATTPSGAGVAGGGGAGAASGANTAAPEARWPPGGTMTRGASLAPPGGTTPNRARGTTPGGAGVATTTGSPRPLGERVDGTQLAEGGRVLQKGERTTEIGTEAQLLSRPATTAHGSPPGTRGTGGATPSGAGVATTASAARKEAYRAIMAELACPNWSSNPRCRCPVCSEARSFAAVGAQVLKDLAVAES